MLGSGLLRRGVRLKESTDVQEETTSFITYLLRVLVLTQKRERCGQKRKKGEKRKKKKHPWEISTTDMPRAKCQHRPICQRASKMSSAACVAACECECACIGPAARSDSGGRDGGSSTSCSIFARAASTIASESRLGCERTPPVDAGDEKDGPGAVAATLSPEPACATEEVDVYPAGSSGVSPPESNT